MKKKIIGMGAMVLLLVVFFTNFHVGVFKYKDNLTSLNGKKYCVYQDKTGYKVLESGKHQFIIKVISWNEYQNN